MIRVDESFLLCYSETDMESELKLVLFAHTFVTCFTARFFLTRYGIDIQCVTKLLLRSNSRIRKIDKENHKSSLEFIIHAKEFSADKILILLSKLSCRIIDIYLRNYEILFFLRKLFYFCGSVKYIIIFLTESMTYNVSILYIFQFILFLNI